MTWTIRVAAVSFFLSVCTFLLPARAAQVDWLISSANSSVKLNIPDQTVAVGPTTSISMRFRNQSGGDAGPWTTGSTASLAGTITTNYQEGPSPSIQFLPAVVGDIVGLNSGAYRPNPAAYSGGTVQPDGAASGGSFIGVGTSAGVYGARLRVATPTVADAAFLGFRDVNFGLSSNVLGVNSLTGAFAANTTNFGIQQALVGVDLVNTLLLVVMPDEISSISGMIGVNQAATGSVTSPDPIGQPNLRKLTLPINVPTVLNLGGMQFNTTMTGSVVAFATVPEPSTIVLACVGAVAIAIAAVKRRAAA